MSAAQSEGSQQAAASDIGSGDFFEVYDSASGKVLRVPHATMVAVMAKINAAPVADAAALTAADLTDNTAGTANTTLEALADGTTYANDVAAIRNNFADLAAMCDKLTVDVTAIRTTLNALLASLRTPEIIDT